MYVSLSLYIYIYIYTCITYIYIYIYTHTHIIIISRRGPRPLFLYSLGGVAGPALPGLRPRDPWRLPELGLCAPLELGGARKRRADQSGMAIEVCLPVPQMGRLIGRRQTGTPGEAAFWQLFEASKGPEP